MRKIASWLVLAGVADGIEDRVVGHELLVEQHEGRLVADDPGHMVEQALVGLERGCGDAIEEGAVFVGTGDALVEERCERVALRAGERRVGRQERPERRIEDRSLGGVRGVVEVGAGVEIDAVVAIEGGMGVLEVALVLAHLRARDGGGRAADHRSRP